MTNSAYNYEIKSQLAKLLATENISMKHDPSSSAAYFDIERRQLVLPVWQNISEDLYDMLVVHEVGHALDTPFERWMDAIDFIAKKHHDNPSSRQKTIIKAFINIIEDARIDKRQKRRYPGSLRNYNVGYKELHERDFFGLSKKDVNTMPFIDRANIWFKHGVMYNIKFNEEDRKYIRRMETAETFDQVIELADEIYGYCIEVAKKEKAEKETEKLSSSDEETVNNGMSTQEDQDVSWSEDEDEESDLDAAFTDNEGEDDDRDTSVIEDTSVIKESNDHGQNEDFDIEEPFTEAAAQESSKGIVLDDNFLYIYLNTPEFIYENIIDDYKVVLREMDEQYKNIMSYNDTSINMFTGTLKKFRDEEKNSLSFMVKEFEMRKSADTHARTSISKTGVLDTNKIHSYKYNDDIFKKNTIIPEGKNHGFVMILDWSGSMKQNIRSTMKQLFGLVMFCKRVQIPFEVYLFRNNYDRNPIFKDASKETLSLSGFKMRNIFSSRMNINELNKAYTHMWMMGNRMNYQCDIMDETPLNAAILVTDYIVNAFRERNKLQIVNTIFLTDGGSDNLRFNWTTIEKNNPRKHNTVGSRYFIRDHKTQKNYFLPDKCDGYKTTEVLLKMLKERTQSNLIGLFITPNLRPAFQYLGVDRSMSENMRKFWRENNYVGIQSAGYDEYYLININEMDRNTDMSITSDMTKRAVLKEFMNYSSKKSTNRVLISKFMQRVCKAA